MGVFHWLVTNWLDVLQTVGIVSGFLFTAHTIHTESKARKIGNLIAMSQQRHSIWKEIYDHPGLARVIDRGADLATNPLSNEERVFVASLVVHLHSVHRAVQAKMYVRLEGIRKDIKDFFSLPVPNAVWQMVKPFQDEDFVEFVERALSE